MTFTRPVTVTGSPRIALDIGGVTRYATFVSASGSLVLFRHVVLAGDEDTDGIDIVADSLELNGGVIEGTSDQVDAALTHPGQSTTDTRRPVDGIVPTASLKIANIAFWPPDGLIPWSPRSPRR